MSTTPSGSGPLDRPATSPNVPAKIAGGSESPAFVALNSVARPKLLDLFCGAGGAAMGYHRAGFEVFGVDKKSQPNYPFWFKRADAMTFPLAGFDVIHASPPCQAYSAARRVHKRTDHPDLLGPVRELLNASGTPYVIENVEGSPINAGLMLCGTMFGLRVRRHRYFEANWPLPWAPFSCSCRNGTASGDLLNYHNTEKRHRYEVGKSPQRVTRGFLAEAMGIDWTDLPEVTQCIPPAYTEWIGRQLLASFAEQAA